MAGRGIDEKLRCSFCNKTQDQVKKLISGPNGIYICDQCVSICSDILDEEFEEEDYSATAFITYIFYLLIGCIYF